MFQKYSLQIRLEVLRKPEYTNVVIAAHAIHVRTTMPPLVFFENFLGFQLQDKHNASFLYLPAMSLDMSFLNPQQKYNLIVNYKYKL